MSPPYLIILFMSEIWLEPLTDALLWLQSNCGLVLLGSRTSAFSNTVVSNEISISACKKKKDKIEHKHIHSQNTASSKLNQPVHLWCRWLYAMIPHAAICFEVLLGFRDFCNSHWINCFPDLSSQRFRGIACKMSPIYQLDGLYLTCLVPLKTIYIV